MSPQRIQLKRVKGWRMPPGAVKVDRTSKWGNPFRAERVDCSLGGMCWQVSDGTTTIPHVESEEKARTEAVKQYILAIYNDPLRLAWAAMAVDELGGHDLGCWCPEGGPCHGDVLLDIANPTADTA